MPASTIKNDVIYSRIWLFDKYKYYMSNTLSAFIYCEDYEYMLMYFTTPKAQLHSYDIAVGPSGSPIIVVSSKTSNRLISVYTHL